MFIMGIKVMKTLVNFLISSMFMLLFSRCNGVDFNSKKWKAWQESEVNMHMRWDMTNDLISNYSLEGKTIVEIAELLGGVPKECFDGDCSISYDLGPCRTGISYGTLMIKFKNGKVYHVEKYCG